MKTTNSIRGLGNDIIEIKRMRQSIERHGLHFLNRLFTQREQDYCYKFSDPVPHFAGRFAAKEAISKALGTGFGSQLAWHDLEVLSDDLGKPIAMLSDALEKRYESPRIFVSISHSEDYATAIALWTN
ncbi:MAG: holo-[acyl-carrier-protein] synthase [Chlamydiae bacterium RIFCSPHIGHO2_12_FULL_49_9]|nr:MAG: holo-[acyl-carrier-protein] synthase [Chlamydiae bacterium RIFCSPHIGHO2_12_FULL_49_9]